MKVSKVDIALLIALKNGPTKDSISRKISQRIPWSYMLLRDDLTISLRDSLRFLEQKYESL